MNVDAFILADFVQQDQGGKLTIVGSFNRIRTERVPAVIPAMGLAIMASAHPSEAGRDQELEILVLNARREEIARITGKFKFTNDTPAAGLPLRGASAINIQNAVFPEWGPYAFELYIDGTYQAGTVFSLERAG